MLDDREHSICYRLVDYYFYMKYCIILGSWLCKWLFSGIKKSERKSSMKIYGITVYTTKAKII